MSDGLVSAILPTHNRAPWLARALASVLRQTYPHVETIVVDDGSTDETRRVLDRFASSIRVFTQPHAGAYAARHLGLTHARGEYIAFIDSDDVWLPDRLARQMPLFSRPEVGLVFGDAHHVVIDERVDRPPHGIDRVNHVDRVDRADLAGSDVVVRRTGTSCFQVTPPQRGRVAAHFACGNFVPTCTVLVRRRCLDEVGGFARPDTLSVDFHTWFRIALRHEIEYVPEPVADYTVHAGGISQDLGASLQARLDLFTEELAHTTDPATREILRRLLFNLSLHLGLATIRGRAGSVPHALRLACQTAGRVASLRAGAWTAAFAWRQLRLRGLHRSRWLVPMVRSTHAAHRTTPSIHRAT